MRLAKRNVITAVVVFLLYIFFELINSFVKTPQLMPRNYRLYDVFRNFPLIDNYQKDGAVSQKRTERQTTKRSKETLIGRKFAKSWKEYQYDLNSITGNPLIDDYGKNDLSKNGELGRGMTFSGEEKQKVKKIIDQYQINVYASDLIPLNRIVPDSRSPNCSKIPYSKDLPTTSVIVPFYNEWPSLLLRTVYSLINRTPRHLLEEIILVDDGSTMKELHRDVDEYLKTHFPDGLIQLLRLPQRVGLIKARVEGWKISSGKVVVFFDSHMEVNIDWLQPLLMEVNKNRQTVALAVLDYIERNSFEYKFNHNYIPKYGFDWRLTFFETGFRKDEIGDSPEDIRPGTVMVGAAYAIDSSYFREIGAYDESMKVWGGENLEMTWRVSLCGGRLVHVPCSHIGHVERPQGYSFPGGRKYIEMYNYKRAIEVWMEPEFRIFVYENFPQMKDMDVGDLSERLDIKKSLQCRPFSHFLTNHWPHILVYNQDVYAWGSARNLHSNKCLDNNGYLFDGPVTLYVEPCHYKLAEQGFSWLKNRQLRTTLQCVVVQNLSDGERPVLEDCITGSADTWEHQRDGYIKHEKSGLCLDLDPSGPIMRSCSLFAGILPRMAWISVGGAIFLGVYDKAKTVLSHKLHIDDYS